MEEDKYKKGVPASEETLGNGGEVQESASQASYEELQKQFEDLKKSSDDYLDSLQRERASFANYRRRIEQDNALVYDAALADSIKLFLPVLDDLERALKNKPTNETSAPWVAGIELILLKLRKAMESKHVTEIAAKPGEAFDPHYHEAVTHEENEEWTDGQIIEVVQTGYKLKDRIIRPALVRVAK